MRRMTPSPAPTPLDAPPRLGEGPANTSGPRIRHGGGRQRPAGQARRRAGVEALRDPERPGAGARPVLDGGPAGAVRVRYRAVGLREVDAAVVGRGAARA